MTSGKLSTFVSSAIAERGFCAACGTPLTYRGLDSGRLGVTTCSLDDPNALAPQEQLGVESRVRWLDAALATPAIRTEQWLAQEKSHRRRLAAASRPGDLARWPRRRLALARVCDRPS